MLTDLDKPSQRPPSGARGHRVILTSEAAKSALPSLLGMAINFSPDWNAHSVRNKFGIITKADIVDKQIVIEGFVYKRDFPDIVTKLCSQNDDYGMSYELADAHVKDMRADVWELSKVGAFVGASVLYRDKAAYKNTSFYLKGEAN